MLWEIAYNIHEESLCLDSLEDFNATKADIMRMKEDILKLCGSPGMRGKLCPSDPHVHLLCRLQESGIYSGENFYSHRACTIQRCAHMALVVVVMQLPHHPRSSSLWPHHLGSHSSQTVPLPSRSNACQLSCDGSTCRVQLQPHHGTAPESINP